MPTISEWIGFACFFVIIAFLVMGWRSGKRQFARHSALMRLEGRNELVAELTAMAAGGSAAASQHVTVVQHGIDNAVGQSRDQGGEPGRVLERVHVDVHAADGEAAALIELCAKFGLDPAEVERTAADMELLRGGRASAGDVRAVMAGRPRMVDAEAGESPYDTLPLGGW